MRRLQRDPELVKLSAAGPQAGASPKAAWGWGFEDRTPLRGHVCAGFALPSLQGSVGAGGVLLNGRMLVLGLRAGHTI